MAVDCEIVDEMRHVVQEELHQIEEAHGLHKVEQIITFIGLLLMIAGVMVGRRMGDHSPSGRRGRQVHSEARIRRTKCADSSWWSWPSSRSELWEPHPRSTERTGSTPRPKRTCWSRPTSTTSCRTG